MAHLCPRCDSKLIRTRRRGWDNLISKILPVRRFQCVEHDCRWTGLQFASKEERKLSRRTKKSLSDTKS